jgi:Mg/Co/Ni transporter MgtE
LQVKGSVILEKMDFDEVREWLQGLTEEEKEKIVKSIEETKQKIIEEAFEKENSISIKIQIDLKD